MYVHFVSFVLLPIPACSKYLIAFSRVTFAHPHHPGVDLKEDLSTETGEDVNEFYDLKSNRKMLQLPRLPSRLPALELSVTGASA